VALGDRARGVGGPGGSNAEVLHDGVALGVDTVTVKTIGSTCRTLESQGGGGGEREEQSEELEGRMDGLVDGETAH
jgi:hypothetical protein